MKILVLMCRISKDIIFEVQNESFEIKLNLKIQYEIKRIF